MPQDWLSAAAVHQHAQQVADKRNRRNLPFLSSFWTVCSRLRIFGRSSALLLGSQDDPIWRTHVERGDRPIDAFVPFIPKDRYDAAPTLLHCSVHGPTIG